MLRLAATVIMICCLLQVSTCTVKERLFRDLTNDYEPAVDPGNTEVKISVMLLCSQIDKETGHLVSNVWEFMTWRDPRLAWSPEEYGGIRTLNIPARNIWKPDIKLYSSMVSEMDRDDDIYAVLNADGSIIYVPLATYRTRCKNAANGNEKTCSIKIGSWAYDGNNIDLKVQGDNPLDLSYYSDACPMVVSAHTAEVVAHTYPCCPGTSYPSLDMTITIRPRE